MADGIIQLPPDSTGKILDTSQVTVGANTVQRERHVIADNINNNYANVSAAGGLQVDGSGVTQPISGTVAVSNFPATQPVSGTVTTSPPANASTNITQVGGSAITEGQKAMAASVPVVIASDQSAVSVSGSVSVSNFPATQPVSGTVTVVQATGSNLHAVLDTTSTTAVTQATAANLNATVVQATAANLNATITGTVSVNALPTGTNTIGGVKTVPDATSSFAASSTDSTALEASHVIKNSSGVLYGFSGYNSKTSDQFIQVFNSTTVPADTTVPIIVIVARAQSNFSYDTGIFGKFFSTGIAVSNSSTAATKTIGAADCWFNFLFI